MQGDRGAETIISPLAYYPETHPSATDVPNVPNEHVLLVSLQSWVHVVN